MSHITKGSIYQDAHQVKGSISQSFHKIGWPRSQ
jgi:hypothetical protein